MSSCSTGLAKGKLSITPHQRYQQPVYAWPSHTMCTNLCMVWCQRECVLVVLQSIHPPAALAGKHPQIVVGAGVGGAQRQRLPVKQLTLARTTCASKQERGKVGVMV